VPGLESDVYFSKVSNFIKNNYKVIAISSVVLSVLLVYFIFGYPIYCDAPRA
jgi:hypothetical protein